MNIEKHFLTGPGTAWVESPNKGAKFAAGLPDTIIIHYTAGADAASSIRTLTNPTAKVSAHIVIGKEGEITQLVPFDTVAWHAGPSSYNGRNGYNQYSIGIEIDNAGVLTKVGENYQSWFGRRYPTNEVIEAVHRNETGKRYWHAYTEKQIAAVEALCALLIRTYHIKLVLGHEEISPGRKVDPGPAFPLDKLRDKLLGPGRDLDDAAEEVPAAPATPAVSKVLPKGTVTTDLLNVRSEPASTGALVTQPLRAGAEVTILGEKDGWYQVNVQVKGWVSAKYVKRG